MIIDTLTNADQYTCIHPLFGKAFEYIHSLDLERVESGDIEMEGDNLRAIVFNKPGKTEDESLAKFECHNRHIDIQICISGHEKIGWKPRESCKHPKGEYNPEKDVLFFDDAPDMYFSLTNLQFAILFPEDVHAPMIGEGEIKKLVVKVKI